MLTQVLTVRTPTHMADERGQRERDGQNQPTEGQASNRGREAGPEVTQMVKRASAAKQTVLYWRASSTLYQETVNTQREAEQAQHPKGSEQKSKLDSVTDPDRRVYTQRVQYSTWPRVQKRGRAQLNTQVETARHWNNGCSILPARPMLQSQWRQLTPNDG